MSLTMSSSLISSSSINNFTENQAIPAKFLHSLVDKKMSGKLTIQNPFDEFVIWQGLNYRFREV